MKLPRLFSLVCFSCCIVHQGSSFQLPRFDDIVETFGNLARKVRSADATSEEIVPDNDEAQSRSKRQTSNIGDESPLPYEIRSSRFELLSV